MSTLELFIIAVGLSMDAFAVAVCKGLSVRTLKWHHMLIVGLYFGAFQGLMPLAGYFVGRIFNGAAIEKFTPWITFILLSIIGGNMIREAVKGEEEEHGDSFGFKAMLPLAVATSIDALAVGVAFGLTPNVNIAFAVIFIGVITFALSSVGVKIGNVFGAKYKSKAEFVGGTILIIMGLKMLIESFL